MTSYRKVECKEFYRVIGALDCTPRVRGRYDDPEYGSDFVTPLGRVVGRTVAIKRYFASPDKPDTEYYLPADKW